MIDLYKDTRAKPVNGAIHILAPQRSIALHIEGMSALSFRAREKTADAD